MFCLSKGRLGKVAAGERVRATHGRGGDIATLRYNFATVPDLQLLHLRDGSEASPDRPK